MGLIRYFALIIVMMCMAVGCTTKRYIPVTQIKYEKVHDSILLHDSIYVSDSMSVSTSNDTTYIRKWKRYVKIRYRNISRTDTVRDSIPYPVIRKETRTEYRMRTYQKVLLWIGIVSILLMIITVLLRLRKHTLI